MRSVRPVCRYQLSAACVCSCTRSDWPVPCLQFVSVMTFVSRKQEHVIGGTEALFLTCRLDISTELLTYLSALAETWMTSAAHYFLWVVQLKRSAGSLMFAQFHVISYPHYINKRVLLLNNYKWLHQWSIPFPKTVCKFETCVMFFFFFLTPWQRWTTWKDSNVFSAGLVWAGKSDI